MIEDFMNGFEAAANLIMRQRFERPEDVRRYVRLMLDTLSERKEAM